MPKLFAFYSQEAKESLGDETVYYYILVSTGETATVTHVTEDESGADYFWQDKKFLGEVGEKVQVQKPQHDWFITTNNTAVTRHARNWEVWNDIVRRQQDALQEELDRMIFDERIEAEWNEWTERRRR